MTRLSLPTQSPNYTWPCWRVHGVFLQITENNARPSKGTEGSAQRLQRHVTLKQRRRLKLDETCRRCVSLKSEMRKWANNTNESDVVQLQPGEFKSTCDLRLGVDSTRISEAQIVRVAAVFMMHLPQSDR